MKTAWRLAIVTGLALSTPGTAPAALFDRGGGLIYDSVLDLTWLQDANLAASQTFGVGSIRPNGIMTWDTANAWISAMNQSAYAGYRDWRLPTLSPVNGVLFNVSLTTDGSSDQGPNVALVNPTASEMAHLYYVDLGNESSCGPLTGGSMTCPGTNISAGPFKNIGAGPYWLAREYEPNQEFDVWYFNFGSGSGFQSIQSKYNQLFVWAVRDGDVAVVPEASTLVLMLLGLGALSSATWRRSDSSIRRRPTTTNVRE